MKNIKNVYPAMILLLLSFTFNILSYYNHPGVILSADSTTYLFVVEQLNQKPFLFTHFINPVRLPGYPLFLVLAHSLLIASYLQVILFICTSLISYWIALLIFKRRWIAFAIGLFLATNPTLFNYFRPIMSEGLATFLIAASALLSLLYIRSPRLFYLPGLGMLLFLLIFTRPEWIALPPVLFPLLLLGTSKRRPFFKHGLLLLINILCIYSCIFLYISINGTQNKAPTLSAITNMNLYGKVLQYHMESEASPSPEATQVRACIKITGSRNPYHLMVCTRSLAEPYAAPAGSYALSIIKDHPIEFILKSIPLCFSSLISYFDPLPQTRQPFLILSQIQQSLYITNIFFPLLIVPSVIALFRKRMEAHTWMICALWIIALIGDITTSIAGYSEIDYARFHSVFTPLITILIWGYAFLFIETLIKSKKRSYEKYIFYLSMS